MKVELIYDSASKEDTHRLGALLGGLVGQGDVVVLHGSLGAGKTVFVQGLAQGLGVDSALVHSPTFALMHTYAGRLPLYHFDLYRLDDEEELWHLGFDEYVCDGDGVSAVEWGDKFADHMPEEALWVHFTVDADEPQKRRLHLIGAGVRATRLFERLQCMTHLRKEDSL